MRLRPNEIQAIAQAAKEALPPGTGVFLFGSRLDDQARGGDIDLLVEPPTPWSPQQIVDRRTQFVATLYRLLEEQRIDVLIAPAEASVAKVLITILTLRPPKPGKSAHSVARWRSNSVRFPQSIGHSP